MTTFFNIKKLVCGYSDKFNLKEISFELPRGSFAGIVGPNGSGKTTLFRGITGEIPLKSGEIRLHGKTFSSLKIREKARMLAIVNQNIETSDIGVEEYVLLGRTPYHGRFQFFETTEDYEIAEKYMRLTDVYRLKDKQMSELSGGEQQLAAIARALTQEPDLLLLDEPTSHLDITHQVQVLNLIQKLNEQLNLTVLMIIHDLNLAGEYCDHLILMKEGEVFVTGTPNEVLTYETIEAVYDTVVITRTNPISGKPVVFLVSEKVLKAQQEAGNPNLKE
jgi:iron complex transport system ATP-binding protein